MQKILNKFYHKLIRRVYRKLLDYEEKEITKINITKIITKKITTKTPKTITKKITKIKSYFVHNKIIAGLGQAIVDRSSRTLIQPMINPTYELPRTNIETLVMQSIIGLH